jgi:ABC-2 type transport system permease protein
MRNVWTIMVKELKSFYFTPIAHVISAFFIFFTGLIFSLMIYSVKTADIRGVMSTAVVTILLIVPITTMRLFAEEKKSGTIELLLTNPLSDWEVVLGKYFAITVFFLCLVLITTIFPLFLLYYSSPDLGLTASGYLGFILVGCAFISVGTLTSSMCKNQIIAAISSFAVLLILWFIDDTSNLLPSNLKQLSYYLSTYSHFDNLVLGKLDTSDIIFFLSFIFFTLFLTTRVVESRKWR